MNIDDILDSSQTATLLRCSATTVEERARKGDLPGLKFGDGGWVFPRQVLIDHLNARALREAEQRRAGTARAPTAVAFTPGRGDPQRPVLVDMVRA